MNVKEVPEISEIITILERNYGPRGFEFHPFKVGWYNTYVQPIFHLNFDEDTLAILVISQPSMFENTFIPYVREAHTDQRTWDPIDKCMISCFTSMRNLFPDLDTEVIHDFDLHPNRRPKMLMQTAAHVAGAAYFYQKKDIPKDMLKNNKIYGVCIHPKYGGWFAIRGAILFPNTVCPNLKRRPPKDIVPTPEKKVELLEKYNYHWEDGQFRDIIPASQRYSEHAVRYFSTLPKNRFELIEELLRSIPSS